MIGNKNKQQQRRRRRIQIRIRRRRDIDDIGEETIPDSQWDNDDNDDCYVDDEKNDEDDDDNNMMMMMKGMRWKRRRQQQRDCDCHSLYSNVLDTSKQSIRRQVFIMFLLFLMPFLVILRIVASSTSSSLALATSTSTSNQHQGHHQYRYDGTTDSDSDSKMMVVTTSSSTSPSNIKKRNKKVRILYVHIGKTGGEYVKAQLGSVICRTRKNRLLKDACMKRFTVLSQQKLQQRIQQQQSSSSSLSYLMQYTYGYMHVQNPIVPKNGIRTSTHYMYSIRQPVSRLLSWYVYNHPYSCDTIRQSDSPSCKTASLSVSSSSSLMTSPVDPWNVQFYKCFPTLIEWVDTVVVPNDEGANSTTDTTTTTDTDTGTTERRLYCIDLFWDGWYGRVQNIKHPNHLYWNYEVCVIWIWIY